VRSQKVGTKAGLGDKLHAGFFTLGADGVLIGINQQKALLGRTLQKLRGPFGELPVSES
jgi:hypothetical protein